MATNTSKSTNILKGDDQSSYQPWDDFSGKPIHQSESDSYDHTYNHNDENGASNNTDFTNQGRTQSAVDSLRDAEHHAVSKHREEPSLYTGKGKNEPNNKTQVKHKKKGLGAIITIALILGGGGAFLGGSNSLLPGAIEALFTEATDTQYTSYSLRVPQLMKYALKGNVTTSTTWSGAKKYNTISSSFQKRLADYGITVSGSGTNRSLDWDNNGTITKISADDFDNFYNSNLDFRDAYTKAKRGRVATFFDNVANTLYNKLGLRNLFAKFKATGDADTDLANYRDTMDPKFNNNSTTIDTDVESDNGTKQITNEDGEVVDVPDIERETSSSGGKSNNTAQDAETQATSTLEGYASKIAQVGSIACTLLKFGNLVSVTIAANEIYQSINYFMGMTENISKMKAGYGDESAINEVLNFLSTSTSNEVTNYGTLKINGSLSDSNVAFDAETTQQNGSPLESNGMQAILAHAPISSDTGNLYSLERITNSLGSVLTGSVTTANVCAGVSAAESIISIAAGIATGGASYAVGGFIAKVKNVAIGFAASGLISFLAPTVAKIFFTNVFETATGIPAGELFTRGASAANTRVGRTGSGQSLSSESAAVAYNHATNTVLAMDAELDQLNHSPFDISNHNTFFGSIAYSILPVITSSSTTSISSLLRTVSSSLSTVISGVSAEGKDSTYMTTFGDCPTLESIGAVGDIYCNPITTTSLDTINLDPNDSKYQDAISNDITGCDADGNNCSIDKNSDLARYISYCANRNSPFGVVDQNILGEMNTSGQLGPVSSLLNVTPFVGDLLSLLDVANDAANMSWANGERCGNTPQNDSALNGNFWSKKGQYYQRYIEDQRILEQMGAYENSTNPVLAYMEEYEAEQAEKYADVDPLVAYISQIAGLNIENAETVVAFVNYYGHLEQYNPSNAIAMTGHTSTIYNGEEIVAAIQSEKLFFTDQQVVPNTYNSEQLSTHKYIVYNDIRNRSYTV